MSGNICPVKVNGMLDKTDSSTAAKSRTLTTNPTSKKSTEGLF
jgi:hypothetical protein